jgi:hypothetical protein
MSNDGLMGADDFPHVLCIKEMFFEAMLAGYVSGKEPEAMPDIPGMKGYRYEAENRWGKWIVIDCWITGHTSTSGWTIIYRDGEAVWNMRYDGSYGKQHTDFLKAVLRKEYELHYFSGGRGPKSYFASPLFYTNKGQPGQDFMFFSGREELRSLEGGGRVGAILGWHNYSGGLMTTPG